MMKKNTLLLTFLINLSFGYAQVGINTATPTASLEILSKSNTNIGKALEINNSATAKVLSISDNGNVDFPGALMPNGQSGITGQHLVSTGSNTAPIWKTIIPEDSKQLFEIFDIQINSTTTRSANSWQRLNFDILKLPVDSKIGSWSNTTSEFSVNKAGMYHITAGAQLYTRLNDTGSGGKIKICTTTECYQFNSVTTQANSSIGTVYSDNSNGEIIIYLAAGSKIWIEALDTATWNPAFGFLHLKYAEL